MEWSRRKFKVAKDRPAVRICDMTLDEARAARDRFYRLSSAAGYADDGPRQNMWTGYECEAAARIKELEETNG